MAALERVHDTILMALALVAVAIVALITVAIPVDATLRFILAKSLYGLNDLAENGLMTAILISVPWVLSRGGHVSVELLSANLPTLGKDRLLRSVCMVGLVASLVFAWAGMSALLTAYHQNLIVRKVLNFPVWWTFIPIVTCFALCTCEFMRQLVRGSSPTHIGNL
ncbi:TRAP transporter small permease [Chelativorans alearense]|uniref:TRAP transporter small permease n=1 Tax=Chelativorans alearense TaxID=2681495 RepID=UPI0013D727DB|nr:TRAP transporter small permease subunit [Chelativorans alearense]